MSFNKLKHKYIVVYLYGKNPIHDSLNSTPEIKKKKKTNKQTNKKAICQLNWI